MCCTAKKWLCGEVCVLNHRCSHITCMTPSFAIVPGAQKVTRRVVSFFYKGKLQSGFGSAFASYDEAIEDVGQFVKPGERLV